MENQKQINMTFDAGKTFYCENIVISHDNAKFILDFRQEIPRFDPIGPPEQLIQPTVVVTHNVVIISVDRMKSFVKAMQDNITTFEKQFGKLKEEKPMPKQAKQPAKILAESTNVGYIG